MDGARVTAIIPTYNRARLLARAIESALAQSHPPTEVLVVDDGSTDDTRSVVEEFGSKVKYIFQENAGVATACNTGARHASEDWIAILDSDDVWFPTHLERMVAAIEATNGRALIYFADWTKDRGAGTWWEHDRFSIDGEYELRDDPAEWVLLPIQPMTSQAAVFRRHDYLALGGMETSLLGREDTHLFFRLGFAGPACAVAGLGADMTDDAEEGTRLTAIHDEDSCTYCEQTIWLYTDVLERHPGLPRESRRILRARLATGYWHRARLSLEAGRVARCVAAAARSFAIAPSVPAARARNWLGRRFPSRHPDARRRAALEGPPK